MDRCTSLQVSVPLKHSEEGSSEHLSAMAALAWLQAQVLDRTLHRGIRHACLTGSVVVAQEAAAGSGVGPSSSSSLSTSETSGEEEKDPDYACNEGSPKRYIGAKGLDVVLGEGSLAWVLS